MSYLPQLRAWRTVATSAAFVAVLAGLASAVACSILVGHSVPSFRCSLGPNETEVCPRDQVCAPIEGQPGPSTEGSCVPRVSVNDASPDATMGGDATTADTGDGDDTTATDAALDGGVDVDASPPPWDAAGDADAGHGDAGACSSGGIGCPCATPGATAGCELLAFCADRQTLSGAPTDDSGADDAAAGTGDAAAGVCTKACCGSTDCDKGSVCLATGVGGNYCVPAAVVGDRSTTGALNAFGGQPCEAGASCRSGLCAPPGFCADTCCTTAQLPPRMGTPAAQCIGSGATCRFGYFQGMANDMAYVPRCAPLMGSTRNGGPCTSNSDCQSNLCVIDAVGDLTCRDPCRKPEDCGGSQTCEYIQLSGMSATANGDLVAACVPLTPNGPGPADAAGDWGPCRTSIDCARGYCAQSAAGASVCVSVCFGDGDCVSSGTCRPQMLQVGGTVYSVLACK